MGCVIQLTHKWQTYFASRQFVNQFVSQFTSHFMPHELVRDSYAFMLREPMHLHTYVHANIAKRMSHKLTCEA